MSYIPRLKNEYKKSIVDKLVKEFSYDNVMQVPKLEKIVISKGVGAAVNDKKLIDLFNIIIPLPYKKKYP